MVVIVKRRGHNERFDERKVYASAYATCISAHYPEIKCEKIADEITRKIKDFIKNKKQVQSKHLTESRE